MLPVMSSFSTELRTVNVLVSAPSSSRRCALDRIASMWVASLVSDTLRTVSRLTCIAASVLSSLHQQDRRRITYTAKFAQPQPLMELPLASLGHPDMGTGSLAPQSHLWTLWHSSQQNSSSLELATVTPFSVFLRNVLQARQRSTATSAHLFNSMTWDSHSVGTISPLATHERANWERRRM